MIMWLATRITDKVMSWGYANPKYRDIYRYNLYNRLNMALSFVIIILLGFIMRNVFSAIIFYVYFVSLRKYTGGFHASSATLCFLFSVLLFPALLMISTLLSLVAFYNLSWFLSVTIIILTGTMIYIFAPINHPNLNLDTNEASMYKRRSCLTWMFESAGIILMLVCGLSLGVIYIAVLSMFAVDITIVLSKITKQEVQHEKEQ